MNAETELLHAELKMCRDISNKRHAEVLQLRADLARVTAEREAEFRRSDSELAAAAQKESAIRARVAELEAQIERDAWTLSPEMVQTRNDQLAAKLEQAEQRNAELVAALRGALGWLEKGGVRSAHVALAHALARAESATPAKNAADTPENREACAKVMAAWEAEESAPAKHPDTERMDWLERQPSKYEWAITLDHGCVFATRNKTSGHPTLRAAIDAARNQEASK